MELLQRIDKGNLASCLEKLSNQQLRWATTAEIIRDRIARPIQDKEHFNYGAWTSDNFNRINGRILGARAEFNPLIPYAQQASINGYLPLNEETQINNKPVSQLLEEIADKDKKKPLWKRRVVDFGKVKTHDVSTDSLA